MDWVIFRFPKLVKMTHLSYQYQFTMSSVHFLISLQLMRLIHLNLSDIDLILRIWPVYLKEYFVLRFYFRYLIIFLWKSWFLYLLFRSAFWVIKLLSFFNDFIFVITKLDFVIKRLTFFHWSLQVIVRDIIPVI